MDKFIKFVFALMLDLMLIKTVCIAQKQDPKIAVVGAGIGGSSACHFLRDLFGEDVEIDLYESKEIGGRLDVIELSGKKYNSGGTVIHPRNMYMINLTNAMGLEQRELSGGHFAMYDGEEITFDGGSWSWLVPIQLLWRYGWDLRRVQNFVAEMLQDFGRIYEHQAAGFAFTTPEKLLESMNPQFIDYMKQSTKETLTQAGIGEKLIDEISMMALRNNYGQDNSVQSFVGSVSLAGIESGLWQIAGGNKQLPEMLVKRSKVNLIKAKVNKIILKQDPRTEYTILSTAAAPSKTYDIVIMAHPLHDDISGVDFEGFPKPVSNFPQSFHRTVATFVKGQPNFPKFGYSTLHDFPTDIFTLKNIYFNSIGKQTPITISKTYKEKQELPVWKVFSPLPLTDQQLDELFLSYETLEIADWLAYPKYSSSEDDLPTFEIHSQLYYINAIEICASAMEMSALAAKNAALLAFNNWYGHTSRVNPQFQAHDSTKAEL